MNKKQLLATILLAGLSLTSCQKKYKEQKSQSEINQLDSLNDHVGLILAAKANIIDTIYFADHTEREKYIEEQLNSILLNEFNSENKNVTYETEVSVSNFPNKYIRLTTKSLITTLYTHKGDTIKDYDNCPIITKKPYKIWKHHYY